MQLPAPASYFPLRNSRYDTKPALLPLGTDLGNGASDRHVFQFDAQWPRFRANKMECRTERLNKYVCQTSAFDADLQAAVCGFLAFRLCAEYPAFFVCEAAADKTNVLFCRLTDTHIPLFAEDTGEANKRGATRGATWDALCGQFPDDLAVVRVGEAGDETVALHLCAPSHWRAEDKIGKNFADMHAPVPGMAKTRTASANLLRGVMQSGPLVRFTWGIEFSNRLNQHPDAPPDVLPAEWSGRSFDPASDSPVYLRVERQVLWPLPEVGVFLFFIRVFHTDVRDLEDVQRAALAEALRLMPPESRQYKGLENTADAVAEWLTQRLTQRAARRCAEPQRA